MSDLWKSFKLDFWWQVVLLMGIALCGIALTVSSDAFNPKLIFGGGMGCILIGIGFWMAKKSAFYQTYEGIYQWPIFRHNLLTKSLITTGVIICIVCFILLLIL